MSNEHEALAEVVKDKLHHATAWVDEQDPSHCYEVYTNADGQVLAVEVRDGRIASISLPVKNESGMFAEWMDHLLSAC